MKKPKDLKPHLGIFGKRNVGKSSLINFLCEQDVSIVSKLAGTTTDPVKKSIEIFGIGPLIVVDTAGLDDVGDLGALRIDKSLNAINQIDLALIVVSENNIDDYERDLIFRLKKLNIPYVFVHNKNDFQILNSGSRQIAKNEFDCDIIEINTFEAKYRKILIDELNAKMPENLFQSPSLFDGILKRDSNVLLITPIDSEAPEGRMILPQVMAIRHVLDVNSRCVVIKEDDIESVLNWGVKFDLAVTDSQVFDMVSNILPADIPLTSFSILFARLKGNFNFFIEGTKHIDNLKDGDKVLILESCTHQVSCDDIGRVKIPKWLKDYTKSELIYEVVSSFDQINSPVDDYSLIIQCGGCVATSRQISSRVLPFILAGIPVTNYGMAIAFMNGIFERSIAIFNSEIEVV